MRRSILAFAFVLAAANLGAQGQPPGIMRGPGPGPGADDWAGSLTVSSLTGTGQFSTETGPSPTLLNDHQQPA